MKQYVIDSLNYKDVSSLKEVLEKRYGKPFMDELYWVEIEDSILSDQQKEHGECAPHCFALTLGESSLTAETLVRSRKTMRCSCMGYAGHKQLLWLVDLIDDILAEANIAI